MLQKGRLLVYQVPCVCYLRHAGSSRTLPHTPSLERATKRKIIKETRGCRGCTKCPLRAHVNSMFYKPFNFWNIAPTSMCLLDAYWHLGKFPTLLPAYTLHQAWTPYLRAPVITLFGRTAEKLPPDLSTAQKRYLCYQKCETNLPFGKCPYYWQWQ